MELTEIIGSTTVTQGKMVTGDGTVPSNTPHHAHTTKIAFSDTPSAL